MAGGAVRRRAVLPDENTAGLPPFSGSPVASNVVASAMQPMWAMPAVDDAIWENIVIAPFPHGGDPLRDGRPARAPHVLTNSWGCPDIEGCDGQAVKQAVAA